MIIKIGKRISGLCPPLHYADTTLTNPASKFKIDEEITCMVLSVDAKNKKLYLTHKKSLINSTLPRFSSLEQLTPGLFHSSVFIHNQRDCNYWVLC